MLLILFISTVLMCVGSIGILLATLRNSDAGYEVFNTIFKIGMVVYMFVMSCYAFVILYQMFS